MKQSFYALLASFLLVSGCSSRESAPVVLAEPSLSHAQKLARDAELSCEGSCSPSVGMLTMVFGSRALQCTASLIGPDLAVTNEHCVPPEMKAGDSCRDLIWLHFAENGNHERSLGCGEIVSRSHSATDGADYAVIRLAQASTRPPLAVSREGFLDQEFYSLEKVDPSGDLEHLRGIQRQSTCRAVFATDYQPFFLHPFVKKVTLAECKTELGNSGSPVLDAQGKIRGVFFGILNTLDAIKQIREYPGKMLMENLVPMNLGTNLACLALGDDQLLPVACATAEAQEKKSNMENTYRRSVLSEIEFHRGMRLEAAPAFDDFEWEEQWVYEQRYASKEVGIPRPRCVRKPESYLDWVTMEIPRWTRDLRYDRYYRSELSVRPDERRPVALKLEPTATGFLVTIKGPQPYLNITKLIERCPEY